MEVYDLPTDVRSCAPGYKSTPHSSPVLVLKFTLSSCLKSSISTHTHSITQKANLPITCNRVWQWSVHSFHLTHHTYHELKLSTPCSNLSPIPPPPNTHPQRMNTWPASAMTIPGTTLSCSETDIKTKNGSRSCAFKLNYASACLLGVYIK